MNGSAEIVFLLQFYGKPFFVCQILSKRGEFSEAFRLLDLSSSEAIQPDLLLYNAILKIASQKVICF